MSVLIRHRIQNWDGFEKLFLNDFQQLQNYNNREQEPRFIDDIRTIDWWDKACKVLKMTQKRDFRLQRLENALRALRSSCIYFHDIPDYDNIKTGFIAAKQEYENVVSSGHNQECLVYESYSGYDYIYASVDSLDKPFQEPIMVDLHFPYYKENHSPFSIRPNLFFITQYALFGSKELALDYIINNEISTIDKERGNIPKSYFSNIVKLEKTKTTLIVEDYENTIEHDEMIIPQILQLIRNQEALQKQWAQDLFFHKKLPNLPPDVYGEIINLTGGIFSEQVKRW